MQQNPFVKGYFTSLTQIFPKIFSSQKLKASDQKPDGDLNGGTLSVHFEKSHLIRKTTYSITTQRL